MGKVCLLFLLGIFMGGCCCRPLPYQPVYIVAEKEKWPLMEASTSEMCKLSSPKIP